MILTRAIFHPAIGHARDVTELMKEWIEWRGGEGDRVSASRRIWSSTGLQVVAVSRHDSLGAADEWRQGLTQDDRFLSLASRLAGFTSRPTAYELLEVVVPANRSEGDSPKPYAVRAVVAPQPGKAAELKHVMSDMTNYIQAQGVTCALLQQLWGPNGPVFAQRLAYDSIGAAAESRQQLNSGADWAGFMERISPVMSDFPAWEIHEHIASSSSM